MYFSSHHHIILTKEGKEFIQSSIKELDFSLTTQELFILSQLKKPTQVHYIYENITSSNKSTVTFQNQLEKLYNYGLIKKIDKNELEENKKENKDTEEIDLEDNLNLDSGFVGQKETQEEIEKTLENIKEYRKNLSKETHIDIDKYNKKVFEETRDLNNDNNNDESEEEDNLDLHEDYPDELDFLENIDFDKEKRDTTENHNKKQQVEDISPEIDRETLENIFEEDNNEYEEEDNSKNQNEKTKTKRTEQKKNLSFELDRLKKLKKIAEEQEKKRKEILNQSNEENLYKNNKSSTTKQNKTLVNNTEEDSLQTFLKKREIQRKKRKQEKNKKKDKDDK